MQSMAKLGVDICLLFTRQHLSLHLVINPLPY